MSLSIMLSYARSGGTLLNKALASLPDVVMLSEVNPSGGGWGILGAKSPSTVQQQAKEWYGIDLSDGSFKEAVEELLEICIEQNKHLIIRDWTFVNFSPHKDNRFVPSNELLILKELGHLNPSVFTFIRDSIDIWISRGMPRINDFYEEYATFIAAVSTLDNCPAFKYEELIKDPKGELRRVTEHLNIPFNRVFPDCLTYKNVNGDIQPGDISRSGKSKRVRNLRRRSIPGEKILAVEDHGVMKRVNRMYGYPETYFHNLKFPFWQKYKYERAKKRFGKNE